MTDKEVMQMALDALVAMQSYAAAERKGLKLCDDSIETLSAALTQPETYPENFIDALRLEAALAQPEEWVGLTDDEAIEIGERSPDIWWAIIQAEAKLKEKNNG